MLSFASVVVDAVDCGATGRQRHAAADQTM